MTVKYVQPFTATVARIIIGIIFFAHGWQKLVTNGIDATKHGFEMMGAPIPGFSAWFASLVELVGGAALIIGLAMPLVSVLLLIDMIGAIFTAHMGHGFFAPDGGPELPLALIAGVLAVGFVSHGRLSIDGNILAARRARE
ncbi:MAG: DoxX family protein [Gordonia sp. (in: high G+C Gram-positive bacteria)]|uniref:DoxX family protein n=1 Tax=Gordonia sp. (in: high G+C Gram-positive bacteria) TaxID=84139 RepID=UPI0039E657E1